MHDNLSQLMGRIIASDDLHARWLNTFSYLEYIGFRKIVKSQTEDNLDAATLGHAVEEGRHAFMLKKLALKMGGPGFASYRNDTLLCGAQAEDYFQFLDQACAQHFAGAAPTRQARLTYLYVTWLVEIRALLVYGIYQEALAARGLKTALTALLNEEDQHLRAVEDELSKADPNFATNAAELKRLEETLYLTYEAALLHDLTARAEEGIGRAY